MPHYIPRAARVYRVGTRGYKGKTTRHTRQFRGRLLNVVWNPRKGSTTQWNAPEVRHRGKLGTWIDLSKMTPRKLAENKKLYNSLSRMTHQSLMSYERKARPTIKQGSTVGTDFGMRNAALTDWAKLYGHGQGLKGVRSRIRRSGYRGAGPGHIRSLHRLYRGSKSRLPIVRTAYSYRSGKEGRSRAQTRRTTTSQKRQGSVLGAMGFTVAK